jgi:cytochrome P450
MRRTSVPSGPGAAGKAVRFGRDPLGFLDDFRGTNASLVDARFVVGPTLTFVLDPDLVRTVLVSDHDRYRRPDIQSGRTSRLTANGLIESENSLWRDQRDRLQPLFGRDQLTEYADTIGDHATALIERWEPGKEVDLYDEMTELTARVITRTLFSTELSRSDIEVITDANATIGDEFEMSPLSLIRQLLPTPPSTEYRNTVSEMHEWAEGIIDQHRGMADPPQDLVTTMLDAEQNPEVDLPPNQVRDEVLTFLFAGHETTALTLAYALAFVANHPQVAEQVRAEARTVVDGEPSWTDLSELEYTERVIRETLRLRPSSWGIFRQAKVGSRLGERRIDRDDYLMLPQWTLHRDPQYFDAPLEFDPDRWEEKDPSRTPAYFPFGAGPHACIGGQLALTEAQLVLATLMSEFDFDVPNETIDDLRPAGVLQPRNGVPATIRLPEL